MEFLYVALNVNLSVWITWDTICVAFFGNSCVDFIEILGVA